MAKNQYVDAHRYVSDIPVTYRKSTPTSGKTAAITLRKGRIFYHFTKDIPGNYIALSPNPAPGKTFKISDSASKTLSSRSQEYVMDARTTSPIETEDTRSFHTHVEYQVLLLRFKSRIIKELTRVLEKDIPAGIKVTTINTVSKTGVVGQLGVTATVKGVSYKFSFYLSVTNPFFGYSVWVPQRLALKEEQLPPWSRRLSKRLPEIQESLFKPLGLKVNRVNKSKHIVHLPARNFTGVIYQWSTKI